jgi:predicted amidohydrolase
LLIPRGSNRWYVQRSGVQEYKEALEMTEKVKVAAVQMEPKILKKERNLARCIELIRATAMEGARLIVFPECALTGYMFTSLEEALPISEPIPGPSTEKIFGVCRELNAYVVIGLLEIDKGKCYNAAALIGPRGLVAKYRKTHLPCLGVDRFVKRGNLPLTVYDTEIGRIGMGICYDANFPEHARVLALNGADVVVYPANWPEHYSEFLPEHLIPVRAIENRVFVVAVNRVGEERGITFMGRSKISSWYWDPATTLHEGKAHDEDIVYAEIEPATARQKHVVIIPGEIEVDLFADRRPELYGTLTKTCSA